MHGFRYPQGVQEQIPEDTKVQPYYTTLHTSPVLSLFPRKRNPGSLTPWNFLLLGEVEHMKHFDLCFGWQEPNKNLSGAKVKLVKDRRIDWQVF